MNLRTGFRGKLLLLTIVPLAAAQVVTLFAVMRTVESDINNRATESLLIGRGVVHEYLANRAEQLRAGAAALATDIEQNEVAAGSNHDSVDSLLDKQSQRVGADVAVLLDNDGNVVANKGNLTINGDIDFQRVIENNSDSEAHSSASVIYGTAYQIIAVPLRAVPTIAWVVMGYRVDNLVADKLAGITGMAINLVTSSDDRPQVIATSTEADSSIKPAAANIPPEHVVDNVYLTNDAGVDWLTLRTDLVAGSSDVQFILQRSMREAMAPYFELRTGLTAFATALLIIVALATGWLSGAVARPLNVLANAARRMISGRYDKIDQRMASGEIGDLTTSFSAMQNAIADREQRIFHQAMHDPLTDLPNRNNIMQRLNGAIDRAKSADANIAVICIRLANLNAIASTLGHSASDQVITLAARHLRLNLHASQILGHIGTSEFILILPKKDIDDALVTTSLISDILAAGVTLDRVNIALTTEAGIAIYPEHASGASELIRNAAIARSEAEARREPVVVYEQGREDHYQRQLRIVNDLRGALTREELHVYFQPKVSLPDGVPTGAEALVRWDHPDLGWLPPDKFIPAAEQAGTIVHVTRYVLSQALQQCSLWRSRGHELQVSVNLSARDLQDEYLPHYVEQVLQENQIDAQHLTLEITENTVMEDVQQAVAVLQSLLDTGVRISMDDFGTGHSSLAQLKAIPLHELKIDKSFIISMLGDSQNQAIVKATIELAHNMDLRVVAEGVEDEESLRHLSDAGCDVAQGFFLSKPVPSDALLAWLDNWQTMPYGERRKNNRAFRKKA
jgi:diguanylate cyclase (GGDEF)-like protein